MRQVTIYCDGSGIAGGHPCGFAAVLLCGEARKEVSGWLPLGTNNVAEIMAAVIGVEAVKWPSQIRVLSDSKYVVNTMDLAWWRKWERNGWQRQKGEPPVWEPVPNAEYWQRLLAACEGHDVRFEHVKGHNGDPLNELCDKLAKQARHAAEYKPLPLAYNADGTRIIPPES